MNNPKVLALLFVAACGGDSDHWSTRKLVASNETVAGKAFSIELPEGMRRRVDGDQIRWDFHEDDRTMLPEVDVGPKFHYKSAAEYRADHNVTAAIHEQNLPDGFIVTHENTPNSGRQDYIITAVRGPLECSIRVTPWRRSEDTRSKLGAAEQICLSIKLL